MTQKRTELRPVVLVDAYMRRSKELDEKLGDIGAEVDQHNQRVNKRSELEDRLEELSDLIDDAKSQIDGLRDRYSEASFQQDEAALTAINDLRDGLNEGIQDYKNQREAVKDELEAAKVDAAGIAELTATLEAGITIPHHSEFIDALAQELRTLRGKQEVKLKALRASVPSQFKDQKTYDAAMKELDSNYRTSEESKQAAERYAAKQHEERKRFFQHEPKSSDEIRHSKDKQLARANSTPQSATVEW